jgi:FKBP-type peptidyl-prolyl cis-trans isomerase
MRPLLAAALAATALTLVACDQKPAEKAGGDKPGETAAAPAAGPGVAGPHYDTTEASNAKFLAEYEKLPGVTKTGDGLLYKVIKAGTGKTPLTTADVVTVLYKGQLINGTVFDQTTPVNPADPNSGPRSFPAGNLIPGWVEALAMMKEGDEWELVIPSALGYGAEGAGGGAIPGNQVLVFRMNLLKVEFAK